MKTLLGLNLLYYETYFFFQKEILLFVSEQISVVLLLSVVRLKTNVFYFHTTNFYASKSCIICRICSSAANIRFILFLFHQQRTSNYLTGAYSLSNVQMAYEEIVHYFQFYLHMVDMDHLGKRIIIPLLRRSPLDDEYTILYHDPLVVNTIKENL